MVAVTDISIINFSWTRLQANGGQVLNFIRFSVPSAGFSTGISRCLRQAC